MKKSALLVFGLVAACSLCAATENETAVPILVWHRVSNGTPGSTTVTPENFRRQLKDLRDAGYHVIPLAELVAWKTGKGPVPAAKSVVLTFDDGHASFFTEAQPIFDEFHVPVTQFLVAGCISHGTYCVNWDQVAKLEQDPLVDLESHTWTHPSFKVEVQKRSAGSFQHLVDFELSESKTTLEKKLNRTVPMLAWPYGIYTPMLLEHAAADGYKVGFSVECRAVSADDPVMAMPRCMVVNTDVGPKLISLMNHADKASKEYPLNRKWRIIPVSTAIHTTIR